MTDNGRVLDDDHKRFLMGKMEDARDRAAIDRVLREDEAGETVPGEVVHAILDGARPLRAWRQHRGLTLDELAGRVGVSKEYLSQIENGRKFGTLDLIRRLAEVLDVTLDDVAGWKNKQAEIGSVGGGKG